MSPLWSKKITYKAKCKKCGKVIAKPKVPLGIERMCKTVGMKLSKISCLITIIILCLIVPLFSIPSVSGLSESFYKDWFIPFQGDSIGFSYKIEVNIQNEANGKWIFDKTYAITFIISITYLNQSYFSPEVFYATFFEPGLEEDGSLRDVDITKNFTYVDTEHSGDLALMYTPTKTFTHLDETSSTSYFLKLWFKVFKNQQAIPYDYVEWQWRADHPIPISFEKHSVETPDYITPILYICIGIAITVIPIGAYLTYKSRKSRKVVAQPKELIRIWRAENSAKSRIRVVSLTS